MSLLESGENYLETILILGKRNGSVRSIDIAEEMGFTKASVSRAMSILKRDNYIIMEPDGRILLTKDGQKKSTKSCMLMKLLPKRMPAASSTSSVPKPLPVSRLC